MYVPHIKREYLYISKDDMQLLFGGNFVVVMIKPYSAFYNMQCSNMDFVDHNSRFRQFLLNIFFRLLNTWNCYLISFIVFPVCF